MDNSSKKSPQKKEEDIFMNAVEIASIADSVRLRFTDVQTKVRYIEDLAMRAKEECDSLQDVATSLAQTATAVATLALKICSYDSFSEAFASNESYSKVMDITSFLGIIENRWQNCVHQSHQAQEESASLFDHRSASNSRSSPRLPSAHHHQQQQAYRFNYNAQMEAICPEPTCPSHFKHRRYPVIDGVRSVQSDLPVNEKHLITGRPRPKSPTVNTPGILNSFAPSFRTRAYSAGYGSHLGTSHSSEKFCEKFPRQHTPDDYKAHSAVSPFCSYSVSSMTPLWEDRYCSIELEGKAPSDPHSNSPSGIGGGSPRFGINDGEHPLRWSSDKKSMKQFQMRIHADKKPQETIVEHRAPYLSNSCLLSDVRNDPDVAHFRTVSEERPSRLGTFEVDYDAEVANLLGGVEEGLNEAGAEVLPRPVSPLLSDEEKSNYVVIRESNSVSPTPERHIFKPTVKKDTNDN